MAEVYGFWSEAIRAGVKALGFSLQRIAGKPWLAATIAENDLPGVVRTAAAAAIAVDKEVAYLIRPTATSIARAALMARLTESSAPVELHTYQELLALAVLKRVAADPRHMLAVLAEPYE